MTTLYRPVKITSAEQAEALPIGTVVTGTRCGVIEKGSRGHWWAGLAELPDRIAVGGAALVPIEAEEEGTREFYGSNGTWHMTPPVDDYQSPHTRYVTPWTAQDPTESAGEKVE